MRAVQSPLVVSEPTRSPPGCLSCCQGHFPRVPVLDPTYKVFIVLQLATHFQESSVERKNMLTAAFTFFFFTCHHTFNLGQVFSTSIWDMSCIFLVQPNIQKSRNFTKITSFAKVPSLVNKWGLSYLLVCGGGVVLGGFSFYRQGPASIQPHHFMLKRIIFQPQT